MKRLKDFVPEKIGIYGGLWLAAPVMIWFSYWPNLHFGQDGTMNFEISLPLALLVLLGLASLPGIFRNWRQLAKSRWTWVVVALVAFTCLTVLWSVNPLRSLLTAGIAGLLGLVAIGAVAERKKITKLLPKIVNIYLWSAVVMSVLALVQFIAGIWLPQPVTLLCDGCVAAQFGFARPNVFAIEPQFLGNMLLPAILIVSRRILTGRERWRVFDWYDGFVLMLLALMLTMSRGAIYALIIGLVVLVVVYRKQLKNIAILAGLSLVTLVASLGAQGMASVLNPTISETFIGAVGKSISQLTLGVVDITTVDTKPAAENPAPTEDTNKQQPVFDGYVEESTDARTSRSSIALSAWSQSPARMIFGAGVGGAGVAMHQASPDQLGAREIVQNEFVERLLERGIIGLLLSVSAVGYLVYLTRHQKWLWSIIAALLFQLCFFSGYPNALHIYLAFILMSVIGSSPRRKSTAI